MSGETRVERLVRAITRRQGERCVRCGRPLRSARAVHVPHAGLACEDCALYRPRRQRS